MANVSKSKKPASSVKTVTVNNIDFQIDVEAFDDVDLLYRLKDVQESEDIFAALDVIDTVLGAEQRSKLVDSLRDSKTGKARATDLAAAIQELLEAIPK